MKSAIKFMFYAFVFGFILSVFSVNAYAQQAAAEVNIAQSGTTEVKAAADTAPIEVIRLGRIPYLDARKMVKDHEKLCEYLKKELGVKDVKLVLTPNYDELNNFLKDKKIEIAWHGTLAYPKARQIADVKAVLMPIRFAKKSYRGQIVVRADSGIDKISDLKGKSFAFTDKKSASGYFFPKILMIENGLNPDKDLSKVEYIKKHDNILYNILYKKFDAGAVYDNALELLKTDAERSQIKILSKTAEILNEPIVVRGDLPKDMIDKIVNAFAKLKKNDPQLGGIIENLGNVESFEKVTDNDYSEIIKFSEKYKLLFEEESKK
ncbi:MAG: phosphate/phosphite/phosphonate ABC transporter substrate-binding protein [Candidatus Wallbacteria bacterium]